MVTEDTIKEGKAEKAKLNKLREAVESKRKEIKKECMAPYTDFEAKYFSKGRMAVVEGRLQMRDWTDKDGNKRRNAEVLADNIYFGDAKKDVDSGANRYAGGQFVEVDEDFDADGDMPF